MKPTQEPPTCPRCNGFQFDVSAPNDRPWIHWPCVRCNGSGKIAPLIRDGILSGNPAMLIKAHRSRAKPPPGILTPEQADRYLAAVQKHTQAMLAADAIGLYAGLDARRYFHCA